MIKITYKLEYEIIVKGIEPFSIALSTIISILKELLTNDLISGYTMRIKE